MSPIHQACCKPQRQLDDYYNSCRLVKRQRLRFAAARHACTLGICTVPWRASAELRCKNQDICTTGPIRGLFAWLVNRCEMKIVRAEFAPSPEPRSTVDGASRPALCRTSREKPNSRDLGRCPNSFLAHKSARNKDWNFVPDAEPKIAVLMEGALVCGVGKLVGGKQGRKIFNGVAASSLPLVGRGRVGVGR